MGTNICIQWSHAIWIKIVLNGAVLVPAKTVNFLYVSPGGDVVIYLGYKTRTWKCFCVRMCIKFTFSKYHHIFFQEVCQSILRLSLLVKCIQFDGIEAPATTQSFLHHCHFHCRSDLPRDVIVVFCCEYTCIHLLFLKKIKIGLCIDGFKPT